jgi:hypothetical protein
MTSQPHKVGLNGTGHSSWALCSVMVTRWGESKMQSFTECMLSNLLREREREREGGCVRVRVCVCVCACLEPDGGCACHEVAPLLAAR